jgi:hypothetical protein
MNSKKVYKMSGQINGISNSEGKLGVMKRRKEKQRKEMHKDGGDLCKCICIFNVSS